MEDASAAAGGRVTSVDLRRKSVTPNDVELEVLAAVALSEQEEERIQQDSPPSKSGKLSPAPQEVQPGDSQRLRDGKVRSSNARPSGVHHTPVQREKYNPGTTLGEEQVVSELQMERTAEALKSPEYQEAYTSILDLSKKLNCGLKRVQLQQAEHPETITRSEYNKEISAQSIDLVVHIPHDDGGTSSSLNAFTLFQTLGDTVDDVITAALRKFKALGIAFQADDFARKVIKIVGVKDYLLHKKVPIGYYQPMLNANRLGEQVHITILTLEDDVLQVLQPLLDESASSMVKSMRIRGSLSFLGVTHTAKLLDEIFRESKSVPSQDTLFTDADEPAALVQSDSKLAQAAATGLTVVKSIFEKPLFITIDCIYFEKPFGFLHYYESFHVEVCLYFNDDLLGGPYHTDTVTDKAFLEQTDRGGSVLLPLQCGPIDTGLNVSSLPHTTRITFRLLGNHSSKSHVGLKAYLTPVKSDALAGAVYTLIDTQNLISLERKRLGLLLFNDGEGYKSWRYKDKYELHLDSGDLAKKRGSIPTVVPEAERVSSINDLPTPRNNSERALHEVDEDYDPQFTLIKDLQLRSCVPPGGDVNAEICINFAFNEPHGVTIRSKTPTKQEMQQVYSAMSNSSFNKKVPSKADCLAIEKIEFSEPISSLTMAERDLLWRFRDYCSKNPALLPKFLRAVPWRDEKKVEEAHVMLYVWNPVRPSDALELLDVRYSDQLVREYAVDKLDELNDAALDVLLLQLVQVLKYEPYHDSALARFLVRRSLLSPLLIGQHLYWMLKSEMYMIAYRERFGVVLEVFLRECGVYRESLRLQSFMNDELTHVAETLKEVSSSKRTAALRTLLEDLNTRLPKKFCFPLDNRKECRRFIVDKCKVMGSKKAPLWLVLENADPAAEPYFTMFKCGDDLRQDQLTLQMLSIMDQLWREGSGEVVEQSSAQAGNSSRPRSLSRGSSTGKLSSGSSRHIMGQPSDVPPMYGDLEFRERSGRSDKSASTISHKPADATSPSPHADKKSILNTLTGLFYKGSAADKAPLDNAAGGSSKNKRDVLRRESSTSIIGQEFVEPYDFHMKIYGCRSTGYNLGMIEIVMNSTTLASIHKQYGGLLGAFKPDTIDQYLKENNPSNKYDQVVDNFAKTCAAYCVGTYILGIGDRHSDNIMVDKAGHLFHIDFGHFLGNFKSKMGVKRERSPFVFLPEMAYVMRERETKNHGGADVKHYENFEVMASGAYNLLRRRANLLINLFALMIPASMPELTSRADLEYFLDMLSLTLSEDEAKDKFKAATKLTLTDTFRKLDNFLHMIKHH